ncbi:MAG: glycosyltransferase [Pseudomonadota bacterium]|nr:glycosyltransferase [Pseudomonadota bacterium]
MNLAALRAWRDAAPGFIRRQAKTIGQVEFGWAHPKQVSFVFGCQRSGTKMLMRILDRSPATRIFHENHITAFHDFQLRSDYVLRALVRLNPAPSQIFKPICDSHQADRLLSRFPTARGLWVYRHYDDVANSASEKWGQHQCDVVTAVAAGDLGAWGWRTERVPASVVADIRRVHRADLGADEGALLFWYLRNAFFFELGLDRHPRVRLVNYEDLVSRPEAAFAEVFAHVGAPFEHAFLERVHASSVGRKEPPRASPEIRALCADLLARLHAWAPAPPPAEHVPSPLLVLTNALGSGGAERYAVTVSNWVADRGGDVVIAAAPGVLAADLSPLVSFVPISYVGFRSSVPRAAVQVRALVRARRPAAILTNSLVVTWVARAVRGRGGAPVIAIAHGWPDRRYRFVGPLIRAADKVVAVSPAVKAKLVAAGLDDARCEVISNGVDCAPFGARSGDTRAAARAAMGAGPADVLVVNLGRLVAQKAHQHILAVASDLRERHPRLRYAIVGPGPRAEELEASVRAADLTNHVRLLGFRSDIADLLGSADIYLSCSDWEGMPLSTIEAMASGLPIVATATEGTAQLLTEECAVLVPVGGTAEIAHALDRLAADGALRTRMGAASRQRALASFGHDRMARELMGLMARMAAE